MAERDPVDVLTEQVKALGSRNAELTVQTIELEASVSKLQSANDVLAAERDRLQSELDAQTTVRPDVSFNALGAQLSEAVASMETETPSGARFRAGSARFDIRAAIAVDDAGVPVLRLPTLGERIDPASLSTVTVDLVPSELDSVDFDSLVVVPKLTGSDPDLAGRMLDDAGLAVGATTTVDSTAPVGTIVGQDPQPGDYAEPGTPVDLFVAAADVEVPDVAGLALTDAVPLLQRRGVVVGEVTEKASDAAVGTVLTQSPKAGKRAARGSAVDLTVAVARSVAVPEVIGLDLDSAAAKFESIGLSIGSTSARASVEPKDSIISHSPPAGAVVAVGSVVSVVVSAGGITRAEPVPPVVGLSRTEAVEKLEGWDVASSSEVDETVRPDTVIDQRPAGGTVTTSRDVDLVVAGSDAPVVDISGIGSVLSEALAGIGVESVGSFIVADAAKLADALHLGIDRIKDLQAKAAELQGR